MTPERMEQLIEAGYLPAEIVPHDANANKSRLTGGSQLVCIPLDTIRLGAHPDTGEFNGYVQVINGIIEAAWGPGEIVWVHANPPWSTAKQPADFGGYEQMGG